MGRERKMGWRKENGLRERVLGCGVKEKKERDGLGEIEKRFCIFLKWFKHFQFKFKHKDSNLN